MQDVEEVLDRHSSSISLTEVQLSTISPEVTNKLLHVLQAIGYENPQATLQEFIKSHNLEYLLQAIKYLAQLHNSADRQEFQTQLIHTVQSSSQSSLRQRLGQLMLRFMGSRAAA